MRNLENQLSNKKIINIKLLKYGFKKKDNKYIYKHKICNNQFEMIVEIKDDSMTSKLIDLASVEEYILVDLEESTRRICRKSSHRI